MRVKLEENTLGRGNVVPLCYPGRNEEESDNLQN